jgi:hypothetical protein
MKTLRMVSLLLLAVGAMSAMGCASVKPYQREHLADRIMMAEADREMREQKWLEAREGSTGGAGGAGGGCACR